MKDFSSKIMMFFNVTINVTLYTKEEIICHHMPYCTSFQPAGGDSLHCLGQWCFIGYLVQSKARQFYHGLRNSDGSLGSNRIDHEEGWDTWDVLPVMTGDWKQAVKKQAYVRINCIPILFLYIHIQKGRGLIHGSALVCCFNDPSCFGAK